MDKGASVPDQTLVSDGAPADRHPAGFDPSRFAAILRGYAKAGATPSLKRNLIAPIFNTVFVMIASAVERAISDSDGNPKGGNEVPSRSDDSAAPQGIAQPSSESDQ